MKKTLLLPSSLRGAKSRTGCGISRDNPAFSALSLRGREAFGRGNPAFKIIVSWLFTLMFLFFHSNTYANPATTQLTQLLAAIQTLQADFTQTISNQKSVGHLILQQPGKFRWEVKKPVVQVIVTDNKRLWIYDPDLEQVTIRSINTEIGETPAFLLSHPGAALEKNFQVKTIKNTGSLQWFVLTPKNKNSLFAFIKIGFVKNQIREMDLQDHLGHNTVIEFYNIILNHPLSASLFTFKPPRHVDVIDETHSL